MLTSRPLTSADYPIISQFPQNPEELFYIAPFAEFPWLTENFADSVSDRLANTVFHIDSDIIGFANFYHHEPGAQIFIGNVIVNPAMRNQGFGKEMIKQMLNRGFMELSLEEIHVSCFSPNTTGLLLYKKLGFTPYTIEQRTDHENRPVALFNFKYSKEDYLQAFSGNDFDLIASKLTDI